MVGAVPVVCLTALVVLAFIAHDRKYLMTSTSLMMLAGVIAIYYGAIYWMFG